ncbi:MAG TPA: hypothetical protein QGF02_00965 [Candidatus Babeliales bacterium]|nr:hypothetical protein [Candidatus Babeliales bacterium]
MNIKKYGLMVLMALTPIMLFPVTEEVVSEIPAPHGLQPFNYSEYPAPSAPPKDGDPYFMNITGGKTVVPATNPAYEQEHSVQERTDIDFKLMYALCKKKIKDEFSTAGSRFKTYITEPQAIVGGVFYGSIALSTLYLYCKVRNFSRRLFG